MGASVKLLFISSWDFPKVVAYLSRGLLLGYESVWGVARALKTNVPMSLICVPKVH